MVQHLWPTTGRLVGEKKLARRYATSATADLRHPQQHAAGARPAANNY